MILKIADLIIEARARHKYTYDMCSEYLYSGERPIDFTVFASAEQLAEEMGKSPDFPEYLAENTIIYREICSKIIEYNAVFLHCAAISVDNEAYLFTAASGTGKTTHMRHWLTKFGSRAFIINGDKPIIRKMPDGKFYVFGTPWCGKEGFNTNAAVPAKAVFLLERGAVNEAYPASTEDAVHELLNQTVRPTNGTAMLDLLDTVEQFIEQTSFYRLRCNPNPDAADTAYNITTK